jgi:LL-diaminopimelate aminotransferase
MKISLAVVCSVLVSTATVKAFQTTTSTRPSRQLATSSKLDMVKRNPSFAKLAGGYLFPEIGRRRNTYVEANPEMKDRIISLGIGDTTQPIPPHILTGLVEGAQRLGKKETYSGYGDVQGNDDIRQKIAEKLYNNLIDPEEVFVSGTFYTFGIIIINCIATSVKESVTHELFVDFSFFFIVFNWKLSDGAKCDIVRLQLMFGSEGTTAVQDPSYPVYVDSGVMMGQTGAIDEQTRQYQNIVYMPCNPSNGFMPDYKNSPRADVVYLCSPKYVGIP